MCKCVNAFLPGECGQDSTSKSTTKQVTIDKRRMISLAKKKLEQLSKKVEAGGDRKRRKTLLNVTLKAALRKSRSVFFRDDDVNVIINVTESLLFTFDSIIVTDKGFF